MSIFRSRSRRDVDPNLTQPSRSGIYFVGSDDLARLAKSAERDELRVCRIDLRACHGKQDLLQRLAASIELPAELPADFGDNWDALADCLRDLRWIPAWGYVLLFDHADDLRHAAEADFDILLGILDDAATFGNDNDVPWFAFLALTDGAADVIG
jgi:RNAse (barnase) inhibitor barstar